MTIGIKYCGGCNPHYDRVSAVRKLEDALKDKDVQFQTYEDGSAYDSCLIVKGCTRCVDLEQKITGYQQLYVAAAEEDFDPILKDILEKLS